LRGASTPLSRKVPFPCQKLLKGRGFRGWVTIKKSDLDSNEETFSSFVVPRCNQGEAISGVQNIKFLLLNFKLIMDCFIVIQLKGSEMDIDNHVP